MKIAIGADHRGFQMKAALVKLLKSLGNDVRDVGTNSSEPCDYPEIAHRVAAAVSQKKADRGMLVCKSGNGMAIAANKTKGIRAALVHNAQSAELSRLHNDANVLVMGADDLQDPPEAVVRKWLDTEFEGGRHRRRLDQIAELEKKAFK